MCCDVCVHACIHDCVFCVYVRMSGMCVCNVCVHVCMYACRVIRCGVIYGNAMYACM